MGKNNIPDLLSDTMNSSHTVELIIGGNIIVDFDKIAPYIESRGKDSGELDGFLDAFTAPFLEQIQKTRGNLYEQIQRLKQDVLLYVKRGNQKSICSELDRCKKRLDTISDGDILAGFIPEDINIQLGKHWIEYRYARDTISRKLRRKLPKQQNALLLPPRAFFMKEWLDDFDRKINILKTRQSQAEQQKMSPATKKSKTKNDAPESSSVVSTSDSLQQVGRTPEEKIGRIQVRVSNILGKTVTQQSIEELGSILVQVDGLKGEINEDMPVWSVAQNISDLIGEVLGAGIQDELDTNIPDMNTSIDNDSSAGMIILLPQNNEFIKYIRSIRSASITYNLSSKQGGESVGDGNFIAHVWRPFLSMIEHLLQANKIDANTFSWQVVAQQIQSSHDGLTNRVRLKTFVDIISRGSDISDWTDNWGHIIQSVQHFAQTATYARSNGIAPLKNFMGALVENPPPQR